MKPPKSFDDDSHKACEVLSVFIFLLVLLVAVFVLWLGGDSR